MITDMNLRHVLQRRRTSNGCLPSCSAGARLGIRGAGKRRRGARHHESRVVITVFMLWAAPTERPAAAQDFFETVDAGDSLATAIVLPPIPPLFLTIPGAGGIANINGSTSGEANPVDIYGFSINTFGPVHFYANTFHETTTFDDQLWLFDAAGHGILGNDDFFGFQSSINTDLAEGGPILLNPGIYYLAISGFNNNDPLSAGGAIFNQQTLTQMSIADGPGGALPLSGWTGGGDSGAYRIEVQFFVDVIPAPAAFMLLGLGALAPRRRRS
jgi:hypothetical protein